MSVTVYFRHDTLTPHNVRKRWDAAPQAPAIGETVEHHGSGNPDTVWKVTEVNWLNATAVDIRVTDAPAPPR